jgi:phenylacetate-CoA ligase
MKFINSLRLSDFLTGKHVWEYYQLYLKTQWYGPEEMDDFKLLKFKKLIIHCFENVPFYRNHIVDSGMDPYKIKDFEILKSLPVIDKKTVLDNYRQFCPTNLNHFRKVKISKTSGTTGQILKTRSDAETRSSTWGSFERFNSWMEKKSGDCIINLKGGHVIKSSVREKIKNKAVAVLENKYLLDAYDLTEKGIEHYYRLIKRFENPILRGYCQNIYDLANIFKKKGYFFRFKAITTTAEPLMPFHRKLFREVFGCETFDQYGCGEVGGVAYECNAHEGLHITEERVMLDLDSDNEIVLTDLDNLTFPLIRYRNGDQAILSDKFCSCGRKSKVLKEIIGRTSDNVYGPNGNSLHWGYFHHLLIDSNIAVNKNLLKFQVIQKQINELDFLIMADELSDQEKDLLMNSIKKVLGNVKISIRNVDNIPSLDSGKFKAIVSQLKHN